MNTRWLIRNWFRVGHRISWKLSFETLASLLYFVPAFHRDSVYRIVEAKHRCVFSYLERDFSYLIDRYKDKPLGAVVPEHRYIWVMWWQGEQAAPELVRMCIDSIRRNANGAEVVVITKDNYRDYVDIPDYIIEKHRAGVISFAHLADITRMFLLAGYGGLWLDSTIYVSRSIPEDIFTKPFYSLHSDHHKTPFVADDRFYTFVLGGGKGSKFFEFERDFFSDYCKTHDAMLDYYLLDYSMMFQYFNMPDIKAMIDSLDLTSETLYGLVDILNEPYDEEALNKALKENLFSKLRWNGSWKKENGGMKTNYSVLLSRHD